MVENIKVKSNLCESEQEMTKFMIFIKRIKKMKCKKANFSNCEGLIGKVTQKAL